MAADLPVRVINCRRKRRHPSRQVAVRELRSLGRMTDRRGKDRVPLEAYRCLVCGGWHVGTNDAVRTRVEKRTTLEG